MKNRPLQSLGPVIPELYSKPSAVVIHYPVRIYQRKKCDSTDYTGFFYQSFWKDTLADCRFAYSSNLWPPEASIGATAPPH